MKLQISIILIFLCYQTISAQNLTDSDANSAYEALLQKIIQKDTTIQIIYKKYQCSKDYFGHIKYYSQNKELQLIEHSYKPNRYEDYMTEYYFLQNGTFALQTEIIRIIHLNTQSLQNKYTASFSAEKVIEVIEKRTFPPVSKSKLSCYQRSHGMKSSEWDQTYFDSLEFTEASCPNEPNIFLDDLQYKYRLLRKAENKLKNYSNTELQCIFHLW